MDYRYVALKNLTRARFFAVQNLTREKQRFMNICLRSILRWRRRRYFPIPSVLLP